MLNTLNTIESPVEGELITVSQLNSISRQLLEQHFSLICVQGEISNLARPASGHLYFSLKDATAQVRCALFRHRWFGPDESLCNGAQVIVRAKVSLYEERGDYQLLVHSLSLAGEGLLRQQFDALKLKLSQEGIFNRPKKMLPPYPKTIGVITSPTGAAVQDVLHVLARRFPAAKVYIYPSSVQGAAAVPNLIAALNTAIKHTQAEVLLMVRGGGSLEDLWAFNNEDLVRLIAACPIPLVTGVGHETDTTLVDFAADQRAPTPSAAAELISPDQAALLEQCMYLTKRLSQAFWRKLENAQQALDHLSSRLRHPRERVAALKERHRLLELALIQAMRHQLIQARQRLGAHCQELHHLSPLSTLARGYSIVKNKQEQVITSVKQVQKGEVLSILLADGVLECKNQ